MPTLKATYTHKQWSDHVRPVTPCTCHHLTYGGVCLNCGYDPEDRETRQQGKVVRSRNSEYFKGAQ